MMSARPRAAQNQRGKGTNHSWEETSFNASDDEPHGAESPIGLDSHERNGDPSPEELERRRKVRVSVRNENAPDGCSSDAP